MKHLTPEKCWEIINKGVPKKPSRERGRNQWLTLKTKVIVLKFYLTFSFFLLSIFNLFIHILPMKRKVNIFIQNFRKVIWRTGSIKEMEKSKSEIFFRLLRSKSGNDTIETTFPVSISITTTAPFSIVSSNSKFSFLKD